MKTDEVIRLEVFSWAGASLGAIHWYGILYSDTTSTGRLQRPLSKDDAISINKRLRLMYNEETYNLYKVEPGEMDFRFDREEDVIELAKSDWLKHFPNGKILIDYNDKSIVYCEV